MSKRESLNKKLDSSKTPVSFDSRLGSQSVFDISPIDFPSKVNDSKLLRLVKKLNLKRGKVFTKPINSYDKFLPVRATKSDVESSFYQEDLNGFEDYRLSRTPFDSYSSSTPDSIHNKIALKHNNSSDGYSLRDETYEKRFKYVDDSIIYKELPNQQIYYHVASPIETLHRHESFDDFQDTFILEKPGKQKQIDSNLYLFETDDISLNNHQTMVTKPRNRNLPTKYLIPVSNKDLTSSVAIESPIQMDSNNYLRRKSFSESPLIEYKNNNKFLSEKSIKFQLPTSILALTLVHMLFTILFSLLVALLFASLAAQNPKCVTTIGTSQTPGTIKTTLSPTIFSTTQVSTSLSSISSNDMATFTFTTSRDTTSRDTTSRDTTSSDTTSSDTTSRDTTSRDTTSSDTTSSDTTSSDTTSRDTTSRDTTSLTIFTSSDSSFTTITSTAEQSTKTYSLTSSEISSASTTFASTFTTSTSSFMTTKQDLTSNTDTTITSYDYSSTVISTFEKSSTSTYSITSSEISTVTFSTTTKESTTVVSTSSNDISTFTFTTSNDITTGTSDSSFSIITSTAEQSTKTYSMSSSEITSTGTTLTSTSSVSSSEKSTMTTTITT